MRDRSGRERAARRRSAGRRESGQTLIELVLVLPLLLLVLFGMVEFAKAWRTYQVVTNSGREGARHAAVQQSTEVEVRDRIKDRLRADGLDPDAAVIDLTICSEGGATTGCVGNEEIVEVSYPYQFRMIGPIAQLLCGNCGDEFGSVMLSTRTVMRNE